MMLGSRSHIEEILKVTLQELETQYKQDIINSANQALERFEETLNDAGFSALKINLPDQKVLNLKVNLAQLTTDSVHKEVKSRTSYRDVDGKLNTVKRFFGGMFDTNWGKEQYTYKEDQYTVDLKQLEKNVLEQVDIFFTDINQSVQSNVKQPIIESSSVFFDSFKEMVEHIRADLNSSLDVHNKGQEAKNALLSKIIQVQQNFSTSQLNDDAEGLKSNLDQFQKHSKA